MRRILVAIVAGIVVLAGGAAALYATGILKPPEVEAVRVAWGETTAETTTVLAEVQVLNHLPVGIGSSNARLAIPVDFHGVPAARLTASELRLGEGSSTVEINGQFQQADLPRWWHRFVNNNETLAIRMQPQVHTEIAGRDLAARLPAINVSVPIPLMRNARGDQPRTMGFNTTSLLDVWQDPRRRFTTGPPQPAFPILTMESWRLTWGDASEEFSTVRGTIVLRNETAAPMPVLGLRVGVDMNGMPVVPEAELLPDNPVLMPGQSTTLHLDAPVDTDRLVDWWTSHLQNDEETEILVRMGVSIVLPGSLAQGAAGDLPLPLLLVPGHSCHLKTDIMGAANYHAARALGAESGPQPTPFNMSCRTQPAPAMVSAISGSGDSGPPATLPGIPGLP